MLSDHAEMMGQHGLWQKFCPYEEAIRVPWAMRWPAAFQPGTRCRVDASHVDVAATLLALAGVEVEPLGLEGESLVPYLKGAEPDPPARDCFVQYNVARNFADWHGVENWRAMVRRPWKYVLHENGETELYHLGDDPASWPTWRAVPKIPRRRPRSRRPCWHGRGAPGTPLWNNWRRGAAVEPPGSR